MTIHEVMAEIRQLSFEDRLELLELLTITLRYEGQPARSSGSSVSRVRGLLKPDGPQPTDAELTDVYADHLMEKYT